MGTSSLTGARIAVAAAFFAQGFVFISLTTRLPRFLERWGLDEVTLSLLLLMMVLLAGVGSLVAEHAARRLGSAAMLRLGLALMVVAVPALMLAPAIGFFVGGVAVYGIALGLVDATSNMQAVDLEHRYGRPILPSSHGYWTIGGITRHGPRARDGAPLPHDRRVRRGRPAGRARSRRSFRTPSHAEDVPLLAPGVPAARHRDPAVTEPLAPARRRARAVRPGRARRSPGGRSGWWAPGSSCSTWSTRPLRPGVPSTWRGQFNAPGNLVALATFPYLVTSIVVRLAGGRLVTRFGVTPVLRVGAVVACGSLLLVALAPTWQIAVAGFTVLGAAVALVAPLSFSAAGRIAAGTAGTAAILLRDGAAPATPATPAAEPDRARTDAVIARFNQFNYVGALLGAVLTGLVGADNLRLGFALPAVLVLALVPLAPAFARGALRRR